MLTRYSSSADSKVSVISGSAVTAGFRSSSPIERVTCDKKMVNQVSVYNKFKDTWTWFNW